MIDLKPNQLIDEWSGFTVYNAETGEPVDGKPTYESNNFYFGSDGTLYREGFMWINGWNLRGFDAAEVPKEGKYIVQFGDGKYMRW